MQYKNKAERHRAMAGGVVATAEKLAKKQADGWTGSKSLHSDLRGRERRRLKNAQTFGERLAKAAARSQRDQEFRMGKTKKG